MTIPRATVRLQFHKQFTLDDAAGLVDYYASLGISHIYASPLLTARPGSTHGYDVVDPTRINPELGGEAALHRLVRQLRESRMGLILDIVPNHMGVGGPYNPWWQHVLEWGEASPYANWFDIDWRSIDPALRGKVLAPFLGEPYGDALVAGDIVPTVDEADGKLYFAYHSQSYPLALTDYADVLRTAGSARLAPVIAAFEQIATASSTQLMLQRAEDACLLLKQLAQTREGLADIDAALMSFASNTPRGLAELHLLLERQHYRLTWWRNAAEEINWRRFFEVSDLAGVRVEKSEVFEAVHALIFRLYGDGLIDGVRIDHVDGLADPRGYCRKLRHRLEMLTPKRPGELATFPPYIIAEKILSDGEELRGDWALDGTTGYEFMDQAGALLHDPAGAEPLDRLWRSVADDAVEFKAEVHKARRQLLAENLAGELEATARALHAIARSDLRTRDFSLNAIRRVLTELLVFFPVYRTYAGEEGGDPIDQRVLGQAMQDVRQCLRPADHQLLTVVGQWLGNGAPELTDSAELRVLRRKAITRFQQLTPPLTAKSVEDTAFYRYGRLLSRNEVGSDPGQFTADIRDFHAACSARARRFPNTLLATATHDHKRGEDTRARLAVLSEMPEEWEQAVSHWMALNAPLRREILAEDSSRVLIAPHPADELTLYQMLVSAWPIGLSETDHEGVLAFANRIDQWQTKALRETKRASSWVRPNENYESACKDFLFDILDTKTNTHFLTGLTMWLRKILAPGVVNSLAQTVLRLSSPGVPDLYQGTEFWDFSLVDPDNRQPVDYAARRQALRESAYPVTTLEGWQSGRLKQQVILRALLLRARLPALFASGEYLPLAVEGPLADHVVAFLRRDGENTAITAVTRLSAHIIKHDGTPSVPSETWNGTTIILPEELDNSWIDALTERRLSALNSRLQLEEVFHCLPVVLLHNGG